MERDRKQLGKRKHGRQSTASKEKVGSSKRSCSQSSVSSSRCSTPLPQEPCTSQANTTQESTSAEFRLFEKVWKELGKLPIPKASPHVETLPFVDLSKHPHQVDPHTRPATICELISAIARGHNLNRRFDCAVDNDLQAFAVPRAYRSAVHITQLLTLSLNPSHIFNPSQLGQHDYVLIDAFLYSDFFKQVRSIFTKEVYVPDLKDFTGARVKYLPILIIAKTLIALSHFTEQALSYLKELSTAPKPTPRDLLERLGTLYNYAENITQRRNLMNTQLLPLVFQASPSDIELFTNLLAAQGVTYNKIVTTVLTAATTHAEITTTYDLYHKLLSEYLRSQSAETLIEVQVSKASIHSVSAPTTVIHPSTSQSSSSQPSSQFHIESAEPSAKQTSQSQSSSCSKSPSAKVAPKQTLDVQAALRLVADETEAPQEPKSSFSSQAGAPQDGSLKPIPLEREQPVEERREQSQRLPTCYFCREKHFSSSCAQVRRLSDRMTLIANRGGCFLCCGFHSERDCPQAGKRCRACKSKRHDTSFCFLNDGVDNDLDQTEYTQYLDQCKAIADMVRKGARK
ncbi:hypothetical protein RB195_007911 [Necator americanus]